MKFFQNINNFIMNVNYNLYKLLSKLYKKKNYQKNSLIILSKFQTKKKIHLFILSRQMKGQIKLQDFTLIMLFVEFLLVLCLTSSAAFCSVYLKTVPLTRNISYIPLDSSKRSTMRESFSSFFLSFFHSIYYRLKESIEILF